MMKIIFKNVLTKIQSDHTIKIPFIKTGGQVCHAL